MTPKPKYLSFRSMHPVSRTELEVVVLSDESIIDCVRLTRLPFADAQLAQWPDGRVASVRLDATPDELRCAYHQAHLIDQLRAILMDGEEGRT
jgi:hypothetical protein